MKGGGEIKRTIKMMLLNFMQIDFKIIVIVKIFSEISNA